MPFFDKILDKGTDYVLGGLLDRNTSGEEAQRNARQSQLDIDAKLAQQQKAMDSFTGAVGEAQTTRTPEGGFNTIRTGSQKELETGDLQRAIATNEISANPTVSFPGATGDPSLGRAIDFGASAINDKQLLANEQINKFFESEGRKYRDKNTGTVSATLNNPALVQLLANFPDPKTYGLALHRDAQKADPAFDLASLQLQAPKAGDISGVGASPSIAQTQLPVGAAQLPPTASAINSSIASNALSGLRQSVALDEANARQDEILRQILQSRQTGNKGPW